MRPWTLSQTVEPNAGFVFCPVGSSRCCCYSSYQSQELIPCQNKRSDFRLGSCGAFCRADALASDIFLESLECLEMRYPHGEASSGTKAKYREQNGKMVQIRSHSLFSFSCCLYFTTACKFCRCVERNPPCPACMPQLSTGLTHTEDRVGEDLHWVARCDELR